MDEQQRVESIANWYLVEQQEIDKKIIYYRYLSLRPWLVGKDGLELGPAEGEMTRLLLPHFERLTVVDGSSALLDCIPPAPNLRKVHSLFEDFQPAQQFDTIIGDHILEHVDDPVPLLNSIKQWVGPGGRIIIGVPNADSIHRLAAVKMGLLKTKDALNDRDRALGHRRVYTRDLLVQHLEQAGLRILTVEGVFFKPVSNAQIEAHWTPAMIAGFYELGKDFPQYAAELFAVCETP